MDANFDVDYVVVGSGFGGSVAALRLAQKGYRVAVLEQGRRWTPQDLPSTNWNLARWIWRPRLGWRGFFNLRLFRHVTVLCGNAVGGGSITYGNTLLEPPVSVWQQGGWAALADWASEMPAHFATARRMLGVSTNRCLGPADQRLREMAQAAGVGDSFYPTEVGVFFAPEGSAPGSTHPDPYFDGQGPPRSACIGCGGCMVGCRFDAKNTLDKNYLYLAEKAGAQLMAETRVVDVRPLGAADGSDGYRIEAESTAPGSRRRLQQWRTRGVVFAASSLGTQELLFKLRDSGALPAISPALGRYVRTNAESLIGVRFPGSPVDLSQGIAIGSGIYLDPHTHIEAVRYPQGSDAMGLLTTVLTRGRPGPARVGRWLLTLAQQLLTRPVATLRVLQPFGFARESMIFLCMQTLEGHLTMRWRRRWFWPFGKMLSTEGQRIPTCIPQANDFALKCARATGGIPLTSLTEILFNVPMTAHCLGGAVMAASPEQGVCDGRNRVFGYRNMLICDGSMIGANLGVNPSLTIAALTERAMASVPEASQPAPGRAG